MKKFILMSVIVALSACSNNAKTEADPFATAVKRTKNTSQMETNVLLKTNEYIEVSATETLFLFKSPKGAKVEFYISPKGERLEKVKEADEYDGKGFVIDGLEAGKEYDYRIVTKYNGLKLKSPVESYKKKALEKYTARPEWPRKSVFYEIFVRSYYDTNGDWKGDIKGLEEKIPYMKELGINALWLMPINSSPSYHGYDVTNYTEIEEDYGSIEDFEHFLKAAHNNGIKVVMDFVINHSSSEHPWFKKALKDKNSPYRDYYVWADEFDNLKESGDWGQKVWHGSEGNKYYGVFWGGMPDLNYRNVNLREEMKASAKFWLDKGVDGFRLDASKYIDTDSRVTHLWWNEFNSYIKSINKDSFIVGENWDTSMNYVGKFMESMDSSFNFNISDQILNMAKGSDVDLIDVLEKRDKIYSKYNENFIDTVFLRNHDMTRLSNELMNNTQKQKYAMTILMTIPATPFIYYGEELGQQGRKPDENLREPMDWYKGAKGEGMTGAPSKYSKNLYTRANDGISLEEEEGDGNSIFEYTKKLLRIRKENPCIVDGVYEKLDAGYKMNAYKISNEDESITIVHNSNSKDMKINIEGKEYSVGSYSSLILKNGKNLLD